MRRVNRIGMAPLRNQAAHYNSAEAARKSQPVTLGQRNDNDEIRLP
jgi:hypothetical protein